MKDETVYCIGKPYNGSVYYVRYEVFTPVRDFAEKFIGYDQAAYHLNLIQREDPECRIYRYDTGEQV